MAEWKKVIVSGSNAELNQVTASAFIGDGSALTNVPAGSINIESFTNGTSIGTLSKTADKLLISDNGVEKYVTVGQLPFTTNTNTQLSDSQVRSKISATGNSSYDASTGVITSTDTNTQNSAATTRAMFSGTGINTATGVITNTNTQLSTEAVQDIVGAFTVGGTNVTASYDDASNRLSISSTDTQLSTNDVRGKFSAGTNVTISNGQISSTDTNTQLSDAQVIGVFTAGTNVAIAANGTISSTDTNTNTQLSDAQVRSKISATGNSSYNSTTGVITSTDTNTQLSSADVIGKFTAGTNVAIAANGTISSTDTNTQLSTEAVEDMVGRLVVGGSNVTATYDDAGGTLTLASTDTNTQLSDAQVRSKFSAGTNVSITSGGVISSTDTNTNTTTTADVKTALGSSLGSFTMGDSNDTVTIAGNLTVSGATTTLETTNMVVTDSLIGLNNGGASRDVGIVDARSTSGIGYDTSESRWGFDASGANVATNAIAFDSYAAAVVVTDLAAYRKIGNIRVTSGDIFIYG